MGRNPVVGRQGPEYHAAQVPSEQQAATITVRGTESTPIPLLREPCFRASCRPSSFPKSSESSTGMLQIHSS